MASEELEKRIESSRVKLGVFEKEIPSGLEIIEEKSGKAKTIKMDMGKAYFSFQNEVHAIYHIIAPMLHFLQR